MIKILPVRAKGEMKHSNFAVRGRFWLLVRGEQRDAGISFANESRHAIPHPVMEPLESKNVDVPSGRAIDVPHAHRDVIDSFELHDVLDRMYRIYRIGQTIRSNALATTAASRLAFVAG